MADLRPEKPVAELASLNKRGKYLYGAGAVTIAALLLAVFWLRDRKTEENVTDNIARQATAMDSTDGARQSAKVQTDLRRGVDANADPSQAESRFVEIVKQNDEERERQEKAKELAETQSMQEAVARARQEGRKQAEIQGGGYPGTVGQDGLATDGRVMTPEEAEAQRRARQAQAMVPPEAVVDPSQWVETPYGRVRPAYQTNAKYPKTKEKQEELERLYFQGFFSPVVVGLGDKSNAAMTRFEMDTRGVKGGFGPKRSRPHLNLKTYAKVPAVPRSNGNAWGGWVKVEAVPNGEQGGSAAGNGGAR
jgi:hypothetical protein